MKHFSNQFSMIKMYTSMLDPVPSRCDSQHLGKEKSGNVFLLLPSWQIQKSKILQNFRRRKQRLLGYFRPRSKSIEKHFDNFIGRDRPSWRLKHRVQIIVKQYRNVSVVGGCDCKKFEGKIKSWYKFYAVH